MVDPNRSLRFARRVAMGLALVALAGTGGRAALLRAQETPKPGGVGDEGDDGGDEGDDGTAKSKKRLNRQEREERRKKREAEAAARAQEAAKDHFTGTVPLGGGPGQLRFRDVAATPEGRRTQFDAVADDVAFEVWLEGMMPRTTTREEPDPAQPGATRTVEATTVSLLEVTNDEWYGYFDYLMALTPRGDESTFTTVVLSQVIEQKAMLLFYRDELPSVERRAQVAIDKLKAGSPMREVVRTCSEDDTTRGMDGLSVDDARGGLLYLYPFPKALFEAAEGEIIGPVYNKQAAYLLRVDRITKSANLPWFDRYRASSVVFRYPTGPNVKAHAIGEVKNASRVRTSQERLMRVMPPARQWPPPKQFGPADVAPVGSPDAELTRRNLDNAKDGKLAGKAQ